MPLSVWNSNKFVDNLLEFIILSAFLLRAPDNDFEELAEVRQIAEQEDEAGPLLRKLFRQATAVRQLCYVRNLLKFYHYSAQGAQLVVCDCDVCNCAR